MIDMMEVIQKLRPGAQVSVSGYADGTHKITWHDDVQDEPSETEIADMLAQMEAEEPWVDARKQRTILLRRSDWTSVSDSALSEAEQSAWTTYRQELRDIPQTYDDADDVVWPESPEE